MRSNTLGIGTVNDMEAQDLIADMVAGDVTAYMIHLAEGLSARAYAEYTELVRLGLLRPETVIIHGTALTPPDFDDVAVAGAKIVWSPSSNMVLYGDTTNVGAAAAAGVSISIAPDWTPSGRDDSLTELRYAKALADERWPGTFTNADYVGMVTSIAAEQMAVDAYVGTLDPGKYADILVVSGGSEVCPASATPRWWKVTRARLRCASRCRSVGPIGSCVGRIHPAAPSRRTRSPRSSEASTLRAPNRSSTARTELRSIVC
jgi:cytosine/adenosine deaminase-related metal-dependent hydrolase